MKPAEVEAELQRARAGRERILWLGALLQRESGSDVVIVGGSAIQVYSDDTYVSGDVDIVGDRDRVISLLREWGFKKEGRLWSSPTLALFIDLVGTYYKGETKRLQTVATPFGPVKIASVEDLVAKRLIEIKVWGQSGKELFDQALVLAAEYGDRMDWAHVIAVARREGAADLVLELRQRAARLRSRA